MSMWQRIARRRPAVLVVGLATFVSLFQFAALATAGQGGAAPAGIVGQVTDGTGASLPGVTVTATSPSLQVPQVVTVTDGRGEYRLTPLPIGTYVVAYELAGFQSLRQENVRLTVGFVARVDQMLKVGQFAEAVTVSGASPLVDVTSTTTVTELTREALDILPTTRNGLQSFLSQVPGMRTNLDIGASGIQSKLAFRQYAQPGQSWRMLEGVLIDAPDTAGGSGNHVDFNTVEGTRVQTVGSNAEMPRRGVALETVLKSGGNDFHGMAVVYGSQGRFEGSNIDQAMRDAGLRGVAALHTLTDFSANMGGRIVRDKLWFFGGARREGYDRELFDAFHADGTPIVDAVRTWFHVEKLSYQATRGNRFTGFFHQTADIELRGATKFIPDESMLNVRIPVSTGKVEWQGVRGDSLVASLQFGIWDYKGTRDGVSPGKVSTLDIFTLYQTGDAFANNGSRLDEGRRHTKGGVSWYKRDLLSGNHDFKAGFDHVWTWNDDRFIARPGFGYQLRFNNGAPFQIDTQNYPVTPLNKANYLGVYAQDAWTLARRLTLNLGLRFERDNAYAPPQCREAADFAPAQCWGQLQLNIFNSFAPRLHAAFDLSGDGKTVIKGGWGRFNQMRELNPEVTSLNRNVGSVTRYIWHDLNGDRNYNPGEVNLDPLGGDFVSRADAASVVSGTNLGVINPDEVQPTNDEFSLTFERELMANWAVRISGIYSKNHNPYRVREIERNQSYTIPITKPDPGPDGTVGTADDPGTSFTYYEYPANLTSAAFAETMLVNDPAAGTSYKTIEVAGSKRLSRGWQLNASYTATKMDIPFVPYFGIVPASTPNDSIFASNRTWELSGKLSGAYTLPYGIVASANYDFRNGDAQARQVLFTGGKTIKSILLNVEPLGSFRLPSTHLVDVRGAKQVSLGGHRSLEIRVDLFNVLNLNTTTAVIRQSGATYLRPTATLLPRIMEFGLTYNF